MRLCLSRSRLVLLAALSPVYALESAREKCSHPEVDATEYTEVEQLLAEFSRRNL
jgi:hypothetical protein